MCNVENSLALDPIRVKEYGSELAHPRIANANAMLNMEAGESNQDANWNNTYMAMPLPECQL